MPLNGLPEYVASTTLERLEWNNSKLIQGDPFEQIAQLPAAFKLRETKTTGRGVVRHVYHALDNPSYGSVGLEQTGELVKASQTP